MNKKTIKITLSPSGEGFVCEVHDDFGGGYAEGGEDAILSVVSLVVMDNLASLAPSSPFGVEDVYQE